MLLKCSFAFSKVLTRMYQRCATDFKDLPGELRAALWRRFKDSLEPLRAAGKRGMVHFQFAPWLLRNRHASRIASK